MANLTTIGTYYEIQQRDGDRWVNPAEFSGEDADAYQCISRPGAASLLAHVASLGDGELRIAEFCDGEFLRAV